MKLGFNMMNLRHRQRQRVQRGIFTQLHVR